MGIITVVLDDIKEQTDILVCRMDRKTWLILCLCSKSPLAIIVLQHDNTMELFRNIVHWEVLIPLLLWSLGRFLELNLLTALCLLYHTNGTIDIVKKFLGKLWIFLHELQSVWNG